MSWRPRASRYFTTPGRNESQAPSPFLASPGHKSTGIGETQLHENPPEDPDDPREGHLQAQTWLCGTRISRIGRFLLLKGGAAPVAHPVGCSGTNLAHRQGKGCLKSCWLSPTLCAWAIQSSRFSGHQDFRLRHRATAPSIQPSIFLSRSKAVSCSM